MRGHGVLDLIDDGPSRRLDTQDLCHLHDVIGRRVFTDDAWSVRSSKAVQSYLVHADVPSVVITFCSP
jgi:hypothetical protein